MKTVGKIARRIFFGGLITIYIFALFGIVLSIVDPKFYETLLG